MEQEVFKYLRQTWASYKKVPKTKNTQKSHTQKQKKQNSAIMGLCRGEPGVT